MLYKIIPDTETTDTILMSPEFQIKFLTNTGNAVTVYAGAKKRQVQVRVVPNQDPQTVTVSANVLAELSIPFYLCYQVRRELQGIRFGPVMGLLLAKHKTKLKNNPDIVSSLPRYTGLYPQTHGLLYSFSLEAINFDNQTAAGYYFDPANKTDHQWVEGVFPLPDAIFRRILIKDVQRLQGITNYRIFNSYRLSKMDYWAYASKRTSLRRHIPETRRLSSTEVLNQMLTRYDAVVLKRVRGSEGTGFIMIKKTGPHYSVQKKWDKTPTHFVDKRKMIAYIKKFTGNRQYLVQRAVDLLKFDDRFTDFRVIMQKDFSCRWQCAGIVTSMGARGGICSNYPGNQSVVLSFEEFCSRYLGLSTAAILLKKQEVIETCIRACEVLDRPGLNYGDVGIDLAIDTSFNLWILEVNTLHMEDLLLYIGDETAYNEVHLNRIKYLTALSGFNLLPKASGEGSS